MHHHPGEPCDDAPPAEELAARYEQPAWDERYSGPHQVWSGNPNPQLVTEVSVLAPGRALDVGCGEGADAVWLAKAGWQVTGLDFSTAGLARAAAHARAAGVAERIEWRHADIRTWAPGGETWDLVSAQFMHQPEDTMLSVVLALAAAVAPGGTLLIVGHHPLDLHHGIRAGGPRDLYAPEDLLPALDVTQWHVRTEVRRRPVTTADGDFTVHDSVLVAQPR